MPALSRPWATWWGRRGSRHLGVRAQVGTKSLTWEAWSGQPAVGLGFHLCCGSLGEWELGRGQGGRRRERRARSGSPLERSRAKGGGVASPGIRTEPLTTPGPARSPPPCAPRRLTGFGAWEQLQGTPTGLSASVPRNHVSLVSSVFFFS